MRYIKDFRELKSKDAGIAGGKGASLGEMTQVGIPVPFGFVVLAQAYKDFLSLTDVSVEIDALWDRVNLDDMASIEHESEKLRAVILGKKIPTDIAKEIKEGVEKLNTKFMAVRSSATVEDSKTAAWAGQLESFLYVTNKDVLERVKHCWHSLYSPRAIFYRVENKMQKDDISVAVVIQKMVPAEVSGVCFTVHPVTQDKDQLIIEAVWGLGEGIVQGVITPDSYVIEKSTLDLVDVNVSEQEKMMEYTRLGIESVFVPREKITRQKLSEEKIKEFAQMAISIEKHYKSPMDIEWVLDGGKLYIVQARPITTLIKHS